MNELPFLAGEHVHLGFAGFHLLTAFKWSLMYTLTHVRLIFLAGVYGLVHVHTLNFAIRHTNSVIRGNVRRFPFFWFPEDLLPGQIVPSDPLHHFLFVIHSFPKLTHPLSHIPGEWVPKRLHKRSILPLGLLSLPIVLIGTVNLIFDKKFPDILLLTEKLVKMIDQQHVKVNLLVLERR